MEDKKDSKAVYNVSTEGSKYVVLGDGNTINITEQIERVDIFAEALEILPKVPALPGKPFHKCFKREREVRILSSLFKSTEENQGKVPHLTAVYVTGPPGSGKTQLARQFGEHFLEPMQSEENGHFPPVVITFNAESAKSLLNSLKEFLEQLKLVEEINQINKEGDEIKLVQLLMGKLRQLLRNYPGRWLLILDNMFYKNDLGELLPEAGSESWGEGKIIVTSQNSDLAPACHEYAEKFSLNHGLDEGDALRLLHQISGIETDHSAVTLVRELDGYPLSLACAATYVKEMRTNRPLSAFSWEQYLDLYRKHEGKLRFRSFETSNVYRHSMVVAAQLAVSRLAEYSDILLHAFNFLSYCTTSPVPLVIVSNYVKSITSSDKIPDEIMAEISRCSLLSNASSSFETVENIIFHQVMGKAFELVRVERNFAEENDEKEQKQYVLMLHSLQGSLNDAIPDYDRGNVVLKALTSPHLKSIINYGEKKSWTKSSEFVVILAFLADCLYHVPGVTENERISYSKLAYEIARDLSEPMHNIKYCQVLKTLGFYYREAEFYAEAVSLLKEGLELTENKDEKDWVAMRSSLLNVLSWTYKLQMKLDLAEETMEESINLAKKAFGDSHQEIVTRLCDFAIIYREKYDIPKAKQIADMAREMAESCTDQWNLTRAQAANYSAKIYLRYAEITDNSILKRELLHDSLKLHADALTIYEKVLGKNHIYVAGVSVSYAIACKEMNNNGRALELVKRAEEIYEDVKHVGLNEALRRKTEVLLALGNADEAEKAIKRSIELCNCGRARFLLADVYLHQKRYKESKAIIVEVLARWNSGILPPTHLWVKQAEKIKQQCKLGILKKIILKLVPLLILLIAVVLGIFYGWK